MRRSLSEVDAASGRGERVGLEPTHLEALVVVDARGCVAVRRKAAGEHQVEVACLIAVGVGDQLVRGLHACKFHGHDVYAGLLEHFPRDGVGGLLARLLMP